MKKVGIITINDYKNYGNRLQNYATQEVLKSLGCEVITIVNTPQKIETRIDKLNRIRKMPFGVLVHKTIQKSKQKIFNIKKTTEKIETRNKKIKVSRVESFKRFTNNFILETPYVIISDNIPSELAEQFDTFIVGSDQVWNPIFRKGLSIDFLTFAPKEKRVSYAASFGVSHLPEQYVENYKRWLSDMAYISVREEAGAKIVKKLTGREAQILADPTLMLTQKKWLSISSQAQHKPNKPYLLTYFLGEVSKENRGNINQIASINGLEIVNMADVNDEYRYSADPSEFIDYVYSAEILLTDSFHGAIFSIILEKPFIVFNRLGKHPSMNSRVDTLLSKFKLEDRKWENIKNYHDYFRIDYSHVPPILEAEQKLSIDYLKKALEIKDDNYKKIIEK